MLIRGHVIPSAVEGSRGGAYSFTTEWKAGLARYAGCVTASTPKARDDMLASHL